MFCIYIKCLKFFFDVSRLDNFLFIRYITITQETHLVIEIQNFDVSNEPYCGRKYLNGKNCLILKEGY